MADTKGNGNNQPVGRETFWPSADLSSLRYLALMKAAPAKEVCYKCQTALSPVELEVSVMGGAPLCDSCRDIHFYETPEGQLELIEAKHEIEREKLNEQIATLEQAVIDAQTEASTQKRLDQERITALEADVERLREESTRWPGPRSRPSSLA